MAMVYGFIKQSGGGVRIRSRQAVGTTVSLLLPQAPRAAADTVPGGEGGHAPATPGARPSRFEGRLVLLVEDDDKVRDVVRKQLSALGCAVLEAESGHEAADMVENIPAIAIVLSDIVMPGGMDGRALARFRAPLPPRTAGGADERLRRQGRDRPRGQRAAGACQALHPGASARGLARCDRVNAGAFLRRIHCVETGI
jgi:PAS/PAC sensor hybrid histidine kinase (EC 2.7.13.3)